MSVVKIIDGKKYTYWSRHKTKSSARSKARNMREDGFLARVVKNMSVWKAKKERSHPWEVYVHTKPRTKPFRMWKK